MENKPERKHDVGYIVPDYCEPFVAWRTWEERRELWRLASFCFCKTPIWEPYQRLEAKDADGIMSCNDVCPSPHSSCGIYGMKTRELLKWHLRNHQNHGLSTATIIGQVYLWGRIIEHKHGYRAQYAYPKCLVYSEQEKVATILAQTYGIPYEEDLSWSSENRSELFMPSLWFLPSLSQLKFLKKWNLRRQASQFPSQNQNLSLPNGLTVADVRFP